jgi:peptidoglycan-associated lipoprotein
MFARLTVAVAAALLVAGCAHQKPAEVVSTQPVKEAPPARLAEVDEAESADQLAAKDFDALVKGMVVQFEFDKWELSSDSRARLSKLSDAMRKLPKARLRISGHCDERGTEEYNLALGHRRAEIARDYMLKLGVAENRVETVSYGDQVPSIAGSTEEAWAANRRDEFTRLSN